MNITIVQTFTDGFTTYQSGQELSVPSEVAQRWIADGTAQADTDGQQSWLSSTEVAATRALVSGARKPTCVLLGDSRWGQGYSASATNVSRYQEGAFHQANALSGNRFKVLADKGVGGNTLADMLARVQTDVIAYAPKYCFIKGGINSLQTQYGALSAAANYAATKTDALALIQALQAVGIIVVIGTEGTEGTPSTALIGATLAYNDWLRQAASVYNFLVWDYAAVVLDPAAATCTPRNPSTWWRDGDALADGTLIHLNNLGAYYEGKLLASLLTALEPQAPRLITGHESWANVSTLGALPYPSILDTPMFLAGGGTNACANVDAGATTNIPAGYALTYGAGTPTATAALVAKTDPITGLSIGNAFQLTMGTTASGDEIVLSSANLASRAPVGSSVSSSAVVSLASAAAVQHVQIWATADPGGGGQTVWGGSYGSYTAGGAVQAMPSDTWYAETAPYTVPTGVLAERWVMKIKFLGNASGTVLQVWAPRYRAE